MSVVICKRPALPFLLEKEGIGTMVMPTTITTDTKIPCIPTNACLAVEEPVAEPDIKHEEPPAQSDIWSLIQSQKAATNTPPAAPYVHPLIRRSSSLMSQKSLEMCTESLGSETGSEDFSSSSSSSSDVGDESSEDEMEGIRSVTNGRKELSSLNYHCSSSDDVGDESSEDEMEGIRSVTNGRKELSSVNYHCSSSVGRRSQPPRSFPPPLPSISRRDGPCVQMRPHRRDGRLVVEAVPVPSQNYLHARRQDGRLLLTFVDAAAATRQPSNIDHLSLKQQHLEQEVEEKVYCDVEEDEEEEEVEVVDRGTVVEVTVSTPPQQQTGAARVHRSSIVINKFVGGAPLTNQNRWLAPPLLDTDSSRPPSPPHRRMATTTSAAAAAVAASSASSEQDMMGERAGSPENKLLFTSKRRNREEMLHHMRRCSELRRPLFFWEPCCIATS